MVLDRKCLYLKYSYDATKIMTVKIILRGNDQWY